MEWELDTGTVPEKLQRHPPSNLRNSAGVAMAEDPGISLRCLEILAPNVRGGRKMGCPIPGQGTQTSSADLGWGQKFWG